jgi:hypothetical protein
MVTVDVAVVVHPAAELAVIVYTVVAEGDAATVAPVEELRDPDGLHVYVFAPEAVRVPVLPGQIVIELTDTVGVGFTVTVDVAVVVQPAAELALMV